MLVLSRRKHEYITIGDDIIVRVVEIDKGRVRLGIEAPVSIAIHRGEVADAIRRNQEEIE